MTKKNHKTTPAASKPAPLSRRKGSTHTPIPSVSIADDRRSSLPPSVESAGLAAAPGSAGLAPEPEQPKRPESTRRRRVPSAVRASTSRVNRPALGVEIPALRKVSPARTPSGPEPTHDEIATRAYFISLNRNGTPGTPEQDWAKAVSEIRQQRGLSGRRPQH